MFYANFIDGDGNKQANLYYGYSKWFEDSFSPDTIVNAIIDFKIQGRTYAEKKMQSHVGTALTLAKPILWRRYEVSQTFVSARLSSDGLWL